MGGELEVISDILVDIKELRVPCACRDTARCRRIVRERRRQRNKKRSRCPATNRGPIEDGPVYCSTVQNADGERRTRNDIRYRRCRYFVRRMSDLAIGVSGKCEMLEE